MKKKFIFVHDSATPDVITADLKKDNRVTILNGRCKEYSCKLLNSIRCHHLNREINDIIDLPFKFIWPYSLKDISWGKDQEYIIIFQCDLFPISISYLTDLQKKYKIKYVLLLLDQWDSIFVKRVQYYIQRIHFEYIFSFDPNDVKKYKLIYCPVPYSMVNDINTDIIDFDLCYYGNNKGRIDLLHDIYGLSVSNKVSSYFGIVNVPIKMKIFEKIKYNKIISYNNILCLISKSNCILECMSGNQTGATLRYYEAICYNKKLLTNNKNVVNLPFYNPDYIHIFEKPEDIDWEWVKKREPIDYHYDGRFSPTHLIDKIIELEEEREKEENGKKQDN